MLAFTHLIPHSLYTLKAANINPTYAFHATVVGYLVMFAIEKLFFDSHSIIHEVMDDATPIRRPSVIGTSGSNNYDHIYKDNGNASGKDVVSSSPDDVDSSSRDRGSSSSASGGGRMTGESRARSSSVVSQQSAVVLLFAMAVHSLFETVALGMAPDRTSAVILATSVALHQPAESLALLVAFLKTSMERKVIMRWAEGRAEGGGQRVEGVV